MRRLSKEQRFGYVGASDFVTDRRYREEGILRVSFMHSLMAPAFALGKFEWANHPAYEFGDHDTRLEHDPSAG